MEDSNTYFYKIAFSLAIITIIYNLLEGLLSVYFGYENESLSLFGFGIDSFIEMVSGFGIAHMIIRIQRNPETNRDGFEKTALRITGWGFYFLVAGLIISAIYNFYIGHKPETTFVGIIVSLISIAIMWILIYWKTKAGRALKSEAILADAECTRVCIYMSVILLISSGIYELTKFAYIDSIGALGLAYFSYKEGKECFEKAQSNSYCSCEHEK